jgi:hypothetical protein
MGEVNFWHFTIINSGVEHIRVIRDHSILYDGVMPAPFGMHLTIGDSVLFKVGGGHWRCKFRVVLRDGLPQLRFGKRYGRQPNQYKSLDRKHLDKRRLKFAGLLGGNGVKKR